MLPFDAPIQEVVVDVYVAVKPPAAVTVVDNGAEVAQPIASVIVMVCAPAETPVKAVGVGPDCVTVPSSTNVNGPVPVVGVRGMDPLFTPTQVVCVGTISALSPAPGATTALLTVNWRPTASVIRIEYVPSNSPLNVADVAPVNVVVPFNTNVYGPVPPAPGVTVMLPFAAPAHDVAVDV